MCRSACKVPAFIRSDLLHKPKRAKRGRSSKIRERSRSGNMNEKIILFLFLQHLHAFYSGIMHQCLRERQWAAHFHLLSLSRFLSLSLSLPPPFLSPLGSLCGQNLLYSIICYLLFSFSFFCHPSTIVLKCSPPSLPLINYFSQSINQRTHPVSLCLEPYSFPFIRSMWSLKRE